MMWCKDCEEDVEPFTSEQVFANGVTHIRGDCPNCGKYLKYMPQYLPDIEFNGETMPFGKYKGKKIIELDLEYMTWLLENKIIKGKLKLLIEKLCNTSKR